MNYRQSGFNKTIIIIMIGICRDVKVALWIHVYARFTDSSELMYNWIYMYYTYLYGKILCAPTTLNRYRCSLVTSNLLSTVLANGSPS